MFVSGLASFFAEFQCLRKCCGNFFGKRCVGNDFRWSCISGGCRLRCSCGRLRLCLRNAVLQLGVCLNLRFGKCSCQNFGSGYFVVKLGCRRGGLKLARMVACNAGALLKFVDIFLQNRTARQRTEHTPDFRRLFQNHFVKSLFSFGAENMQLAENI